jgi:hypothetical protein
MLCGLGNANKSQNTNLCISLNQGFACASILCFSMSKVSLYQ